MILYLIAKLGFESMFEWTQFMIHMKINIDIPRTTIDDMSVGNRHHLNLRVTKSINDGYD